MAENLLPQARSPPAASLAVYLWVRLTVLALLLTQGGVVRVVVLVVVLDLASLARPLKAVTSVTGPAELSQWLTLAAT
jgi:hypothetical protein